MEQNKIIPIWQGQAVPVQPSNLSIAGKKKGGRPPGTARITPELTERIKDLIAKGCAWQTAAIACGIPGRTLNRWRELGGKGIAKYVKFFARLENASAIAESSHAIRLSAAGKDWMACATWLERRNPELWMRSEARRVHQTGETTAKLAVFSFQIAPNTSDSKALPADSAVIAIDSTPPPSLPEPL